MKKTVLLHRGRKNEENFQIVSVNGRSWKIMKGVEVQVPDYVAEVLENAQMMADTARRYVDRMAQVDDLLPNIYPGEQKRRWLRQAEGFVLEEVVRAHEGGEAAELPDELADAAPLLASAPYDGLYRHDVEAQIHYAHGELERSNNAMALWNNGLMTLRDHWCRGHMPRRQARALRLC